MASHSSSTMPITPMRTPFFRIMCDLRELQTGTGGSVQHQTHGAEGTGGWRRHRRAARRFNSTAPRRKPRQGAFDGTPEQQWARGVGEGEGLVGEGCTGRGQGS